MMPQFLFLTELVDDYKEQFLRAKAKSDKATNGIDYRTGETEALAVFMCLVKYRNTVLNRTRWKAQRQYADKVLQSLNAPLFHSYIKVK